MTYPPNHGFKNFHELGFRPFYRPGYVYVFFYADGSKAIPFYVGQTTRIWGRLDDYYWAEFNAATDFRVGEAIRYLHRKRRRVTVKYRPSADPHREEAELIAELRAAQVKLLNDERGYDHTRADEKYQRERIQLWVNDRLRKPRPPAPDELARIFLENLKYNTGEKEEEAESIAASKGPHQER
jgi:hypothetical protein